MTREETMKILVTMQAAYPNYKPTDKSSVLNLWTVMLQEYSYEQTATALKTYISSDDSGFAPSVGQLIGMIQKTSVEEELNEMEAWALVSKALRNGYYGAETEFEKLPTLVQKAVGSPSNLRNWSQTDSESVENVIQSNFLRTYRTMVARTKETERMPQEVRERLGELYRPRILGGRGTEASEEKKVEERTCIPMPEGLSENLRKELFPE